jgi:hypothetical protein
MDNPKKAGEPDRSLVNVNQKHEIDYWSKKWGVSEEKLRQAVAAVGTSAAKVAQHLGKQ